MDQTQIDQIVNRVIAMLQARMIATVPPQRVLMLFSGASTGYVVGMDAIKLLSQADHELTVFMTASAKHVIGEENVRQAGAKDIFGPDQWVDTPALVREADLVLVPTLSMNTAARLALGLMDSLFSTLVLGSLLAGNPVIAVRDGADPYGSGGLIWSDDFSAAPTLRGKMDDNLDLLQTYGAEIVEAEQFVPTVIRQLLGRQAAPVPARPVGQATHRFASNGRAPIVTAADLNACAPGSQLLLPANARLTPLAQDSVSRRNLTLLFE